MSIWREPNKEFDIELCVELVIQSTRKEELRNLPNMKPKFTFVFHSLGEEGIPSLIIILREPGDGVIISRGISLRVTP